ncbi:MAG: hypothetical protein JRE65_03360 [Deltaproteobacteria bacterium]|jgi:hypothetical protein|nr:hypothetical protein [Deltaproteobacteria bacterium]
MFSLTRSNLLRQLPDLNEIIRRLTVNRDRYPFNRNIFLATAIDDKISGTYYELRQQNQNEPFLGWPESFVKI